MVEESRIAVYEYLSGILESVSENVYLMDEPKELTDSDTMDGFIVISLDDAVDASEFHGNTYGYVRAYVRCYVPPMSRGRLDIEKYKTFEDSTNAAINAASSDSRDGTYWIYPDSIISADLGEHSNAGNTYLTFVKSFIVVIDKETSE